jgi:RNA polymerase sigma-70 factor (ECF subfamily)
LTDDELVARARTDGEALGRLYERFYGKIYRYCLHRLFAPEVAEDVTSTVFLRVAGAVGGFAGSSVGDFRRWLYAIASNEANAYVRKARRRCRLLDAAAKRATGDRRRSLPGDDREVTWPILYEAILKLKPRDQTAITLRFLEGMSPSDIAEVLCCKPAAIRVRVCRALSKLRKHIERTMDHSRRQGRV